MLLSGNLEKVGVGTSYIPSHSDDLGETSLRAILDIGLFGYATTIYRSRGR